MFNYKGYIGKIDYDDEAGIFHGEVINTRDVITFQGKSVSELKRALKDSMEDYLGKSQVDVAALVSEIIGHLPPKLDARQRVKVNVSRDAGLVQFNPDALKLIMLNLIENALIYSQKNSPVRVEVAKESEKRAMKGGGILKVRVQDDGVGIPLEYRRRCP